MIELMIFIFGAAIGSFLNVIIRRLETGEDIVKKRSYCPKCGQILRWHDLIPLVSFFMLRRRCRACQEKISWQYPLVETATGLIFLLIFNFSAQGGSALGGQFSIFNEIFNFKFQIIELASFFYLLYTACSLLVIFVYDWRHYIIPDIVLWPAVVISLAYRIFDALARFNPPTPLSEGGRSVLAPLLKGGAGGLSHFSPYLLAALGAAAFFLFLVLITRGRGMGVGDVKLAFLMGLILGWPNILIALFLAFFSGALVGVGLIIAGRKTLRSQVPFGPFLVGATIFTLFLGQIIADLYFKFFV